MLEKQIKNMRLSDWAFAKLGVAAFVLFLIGIWPALRNLVLKINPWYFLIVSIIAAAIVLIRIFRK